LKKNRWPYPPGGRLQTHGNTEDATCTPPLVCRISDGGSEDLEGDTSCRGTIAPPQLKPMISPGGTSKFFFRHLLAPQNSSTVSMKQSGRPRVDRLALGRISALPRAYVFLESVSPSRCARNWWPTKLGFFFCVSFFFFFFLFFFFAGGWLWLGGWGCFGVKGFFSPAMTAK